MQSFLEWLSGLVETLLAGVLPSGIYDRLAFLYDAVLVVLAAGLLFLVAAVVSVIVMVLRMRKRAGAAQG